MASTREIMFASGDAVHIRWGGDASQYTDFGLLKILHVSQAIDSMACSIPSGKSVVTHAAPGGVNLNNLRYTAHILQDTAGIPRRFTDASIARPVFPPMMGEPRLCVGPTKGEYPPSRAAHPFGSCPYLLIGPTSPNLCRRRLPRSFLSAGGGGWRTWLCLGTMPPLPRSS